MSTYDATFHHQRPASAGKVLAIEAAYLLACAASWVAARAFGFALIGTVGGSIVCFAAGYDMVAAKVAAAGIFVFVLTGLSVKAKVDLAAARARIRD